MKTQHHIDLIRILAAYGVTGELKEELLCVFANDKSLCFHIVTEKSQYTFQDQHPLIYLDQLLSSAEKIAALILSKLKLNTTVFARSCEVKKVDKQTTKYFLEKFHLLNATQSAFNLGLYYKNELIALATFSKGRKMNRLKEDQRSFELIRFCCKNGITVTGGLSKLVKNFCKEKKAGDVMTYVDKQLSDGKSFINAGFRKHSETEPNYFLVNRITFERMLTDKETEFDTSKYYLVKNLGNIKLVYTPEASR